MTEKLLVNQWLIVWQILLVCFGAYLVYRNNRMKRFAAAAAEFRDAFSQELAALKSPAGPDVQVPELLVAAFPRHSSAFEKFRHHLPVLRRKRFEESWKRYHSGHGFDAEKFEIQKHEQLFLEYYALDDEAGAVPLAIERITDLLSHAKQT